jgi:hypothetical protein
VFQWLGLCCLTPLSTKCQLYRGGQCYWWRKPEYPEKTTDPAANNQQTLSHHVIWSTPRLSGIRTHNVSGETFIHYTGIEVLLYLFSTFLILEKLLILTSTYTQ